MRKRTDAIEDHVDQARSPQGFKQPGVFIIPRKLPLDEWEALAIPAQQILMQTVRNPEDK